MEPRPGQVWVGRNHGSLLKVIGLSEEDGEAWVEYKVLSTNNPQIVNLVGKIESIPVEYFQEYAFYPGDLL